MVLAQQQAAAQKAAEAKQQADALAAQKKAEAIAAAEAAIAAIERETQDIPIGRRPWRMR